MTILPKINPTNFNQYCSSSKILSFPSIEDVTIKYITAIKKPITIAGPPNLGIGLLCILLSSFGISMAPIFLATFIVYGVSTNDVINANKKAIAISPHIRQPPMHRIISH